ncbi:proton-dependent oligopeptide transporter, POT family [Rhodococcus triatomae]|uniref:Proton-dependent oligopeptide transporter, POT family n=1 Tax=Rhodococcus triatomae TaxID=300028 RepID=A0A1G8GPH2_9NOCA|nr:proton-dependent oligopeptide transporter, POT family [Rhodococcus triatomae]
MAGTLAKYYDENDEVPYFRTIGIASVATGVVLALCSPWISRLMRGVH